MDDFLVYDENLIPATAVMPIATVLDDRMDVWEDEFASQVKN